MSSPSLPSLSLVYSKERAKREGENLIFVYEYLQLPLCQNLKTLKFDRIDRGKERCSELTRAYVVFHYPKEHDTLSGSFTKLLENFDFIVAVVVVVCAYLFFVIFFLLFWFVFLPLQFISFSYFFY